MADNLINTDQTSTVFVDTLNESWLFTKNTSINVTNQHGIYESSSGNTMTVLADVKVTGASYDGIRFQGSGSSVSIGADSVINAVNARAGIQYDGSGGHITVNGQIRGGQYAIHGDIRANVDINGKLTGEAGIVFDNDGSDINNRGLIDVTGIGISSEASGTLIVNEKGGEIHSDDKGVVFSGTGDGVLVNKGLIQAGNVAIEGGDENFDITNIGRIVGDVMLGDGQDRFDTRKGELNGKVYGGGDDDSYLVARSSVKVGEALNGGIDTVYSTASYTLSDHVENLYLRGDKDIDGHGSQQENYLKGNAGDNRLFGKAGNDTLDGGKGMDRLTGGNDSDSFVFNSGYGTDRITDFQDGLDHISTGFVTSQQDFDDLLADGSIRQVQDDVVIDFGGGDKLVIEHFLKGDLDYGDF